MPSRRRLPGQNVSSPAGASEQSHGLASPIEQASYTNANAYAADFDPTRFQIGACTLKPYGTLWTDIIYASSRTFPGFFVLWIQSEETQGEKIDATA